MWLVIEWLEPEAHPLENMDFSGLWAAGFIQGAQSGQAYKSKAFETEKDMSSQRLILTPSDRKCLPKQLQ